VSCMVADARVLIAALSLLMLGADDTADVLALAAASAACEHSSHTNTTVIILNAAQA